MKKLFLLAALVTAGSALAMAPQEPPRSLWERFRSVVGQLTGSAIAMNPQEPPRNALAEFCLLLNQITSSDSQEEINELLGGFIQNIINQNPADISPQDKNDFLCLACERNLPVSIIKALHDWGADVNGSRSWYRTHPLWCALIPADHTVVQFLIDRGAHTNVRLFGQGLLNAALCHWRYKNAAVLLDAGFDAQSVLTSRGDFSSNISLNSLAFLILYTCHMGRLYSNESGIGLLDIRDRNGRTMLEDAQRNKDTAAIQLLSNPESAGELYPNAQEAFREIMLEKSGITNVRNYVRKRELDR